MARNNFAAAALFLFVLILAYAGVSFAENIKLKFSDGSELEGEVMNFDENTGFDFKMKDNGLVLKFRWENMKEDEIAILKSQLLNKPEPEPGKDPADEPGGKKEPPKEDKNPPDEPPVVEKIEQPKAFSLGKISVLKVFFDNGKIAYGFEEKDSSDHKVLVLRQRGRTANYYRVRVKKTETVRVAPELVLDSDQIYEYALKKFKLKNAEDQYRMALFCLENSNFVRARQHFEQCLLVTENNKLAPLAEEMLNKLDDMLVSEDEANKILYGVLLAEAQDDYESAMELIKSLETDYPDSFAVKRLAEIKKRILDKEEEAKKIK